MAYLTARLQLARAASVTRPPSCAAALAAAQLSAGPEASRLALGQGVTANAGTAASIMIAPAEMERQDFKDIETSARFYVHWCSGLSQDFFHTSELLVCAAACSKSNQRIAKPKKSGH